MFEAQNIFHRRGAHTLFSSLSFSLNQGETIGIKGANGSGKTTLLRIVAGLIQPFSGTLLWQGKKITSAYQQSLLYIGHKLCLHPEALVKEQVQIWQDFYGITKPEIEASLEIWDVLRFQHKKVAYLSQGQQKRLSLSRCGWLNRSLWLLDEPQASLDQEGKNILERVMQKHIENQGMIMVATHEAILTAKEIHL